MADALRQGRTNRREHQQTRRPGLRRPRLEKIHLFLDRQEGLPSPTPVPEVRSGGPAGLKTGLHPVNRRGANPQQIRGGFQSQPCLCG